MADVESPLSWEEIFGVGYKDRGGGTGGYIDIETGENTLPDEKSGLPKDGSFDELNS